MVEKYQSAVTKLQTVMNGMGLECRPDEVVNIPQGENTKSFIEAFKDVQRLSLKLDQYVDLPDEVKQTIEETIPADTLQSFRTAYVDLARRTRQPGEGRGPQTPEGDETDFELSLFSSAVVDFDYIMRLVAIYTSTHKQKVMVTKEQIIQILSGSVELMKEREYIEAFIREEIHQGSGLTEEQIRQKYIEYKERRFGQQFDAIATQYAIDNETLQRFVTDTVRLRRLDEDALRDLLSHIDGWKQRKAAKEGLLAQLAPLFDLLANGATIEGLNAYVNEQ